MKKIFFLLIFSMQLFCSYAANVSVSIMPFAFSALPNNLNIGDVITWTNNDAMTHTVTSSSVPTGAAIFDGTVAAGTTFQYTVTVAGSYAYFCKFHTSMVGSFQVGTATATTKPALTLNAIYPNPAVDNVHIESPKTITSVDVYSETGALIKTVSFSSDKIDLPVGELEKGVYLIRIESADGLVETKRIIKN